MPYAPFDPGFLDQREAFELGYDHGSELHDSEIFPTQLDDPLPQLGEGIPAGSSDNGVIIGETYDENASLFVSSPPAENDSAQEDHAESTVAAQPATDQGPKPVKSVGRPRGRNTKWQKSMPLRRSTRIESQSSHSSVVSSHASKTGMAKPPEGRVGTGGGRGAGSRRSRGRARGGGRGGARGGTRGDSRGRARLGRKQPARSGESTSSQEWEVEKIVGSRIDADTYQHFYEVKWKGFSDKENTWEPKTNLTHCPAAVSAYEAKAKAKVKAKTKRK